MRTTLTMRRYNLYVVLACLPLAELHGAAAALDWPDVTRECKPWTYYWWHGSAVDKENLTRELTRFRDAGFGGVHIIPIYGAKGAESRYVPYLSLAWLDLLRHTVAEGERLGLGVDMTTGTGWPFGGPNVTPANASSKLVLTNSAVEGGATLTLQVPPLRADAAGGARANSDGALVAGRGAGEERQLLLAVSESGERLDLTDKPDSQGRLVWTAPPGRWQLFALSRRVPVQRVKRAAPGAEGNVLDPFSPAAMRAYLARFDEAFATYRGPWPRAQYHDSYEYFDADWTPELFEAFAARRGYDLRSQLPALAGQGDTDSVARVKSDYRETLSELHLAFLQEWVRWAQARGFRTRNQAHGSPGNLLDHYAAADIPETEMYSADRSMLISKFASSAAHVTGKRLVSSETGTWLKQHFQETLADMKTLVDEFFLAGVNHVVFHGTAYSPDDAAWPGWLFYAATQFNPRNAFWRDAPALTAYIARCQSALQEGAPDSGLLLYWPVYDDWHTPEGLLASHNVHQRKWFEEAAVGKLAARLWKRGYAFDYVSDAQLAGARAEGREILLGARYDAVVVPACGHLPVPTLAKLLALAEAGATVIFSGRLPEDVPGFADLDARRAAFRALLARVRPDGALGKGRVLVGDAEAALAAAGARREAMADDGVLFVRRAAASGPQYFIANLSGKALDGWLPLSASGASAALLDPMTGRTGVGALKPRAGGSDVFVQLAPGETLLVRLCADPDLRGARWPYRRAAGDAVALPGPWRVTFLQGGPEQPPPFETGELGSWTLRGGEAERFAGTALYATTFDAPAEKEGWLLELGEVAESARVRLNGRDLGTVFAPPFRVALDGVRPTGNALEVEVTNLSANRIRDLDRRGVRWRIFNDINFISLGAKPFDASGWPVRPSGLLGPVVLRETRAVCPDKGVGLPILFGNTALGGSLMKRPDALLDTVTLETLSQGVVVGLMGLTLMNETP